MSFTLEPISKADLLVLADSGLPDGVAGRTADGALPPPFVAKRSLGQLAQGHEELWCHGFYIVRNTDGLVVGGCGFKGAPMCGQVEIGYAVSPACRNQGAATQAVRELIQRAFATGAISEILAQVNPANASSTRIVEKLGFARGEVEAGEGGELLVQWVLRKPLTTSR
ncbi:MAG TPA: GNAT family protein [Thermoanaerobaculia bacterium]|jgi:RimJ/RimL family protein N-acetyltransferase|nr:GNAT family protein [Thermoanaerobaculia bacterium]